MWDRYGVQDWEAVPSQEEDKHEQKSGFISDKIWEA